MLRLSVCAQLINQLPLSGPQTVYTSFKCQLSPPRGPSFRGSVRRSITKSPTGSFALTLSQASITAASPPHPAQDRTTAAYLHFPTSSHVHPSYPTVSSPPLPAPGLSGPGNYPTNSSLYLTLNACLAKQTVAQLHRLNTVLANCEALVHLSGRGDFCRLSNGLSLFMVLWCLWMWIGCKRNAQVFGLGSGAICPLLAHCLDAVSKQDPMSTHLAVEAESVV